MGDTGAGPAHTDLLQRFFELLEARVDLYQGDTIDDPGETLATTLDALRELLTQPTRTHAAEGPPPRRVAVAMALALQSQPHLASTFDFGGDGGTEKVHEREHCRPEAPFVLSNEVLESALSLSEWELDELREDVDRRASRSLKQHRCLHYLWTHFGLQKGNHDGLFRVLFPGAPRTRTRPELLRRHTQLYAVVEQEPSPPILSLYLSWLPIDPATTLAPQATFNHRSVDVGLRRSLSRSIGADEAEVNALLDGMVTILPRHRVAQFLEHDQWRSSGFATISDLCPDYVAANWLTRRIKADGAEWKRWLRANKDGSLEVLGEERALFDALAMSRVQAMMRQLYGALIARVDSEPVDHEPGLDDLHLYDVGRHLRLVLAPLLMWASDPRTHTHIANTLKIDLGVVAERMLEIRELWEDQAGRAWYGPPTESRRHSIQTILARHLIALHGSLRRMTHRVPDSRWGHRSLLLLFTAHYLSEARIERLWLKGLSDSIVDEASPLPPPEDVVGTWFWTIWQRLLNQIDSETAATITGY